VDDLLGLPAALTGRGRCLVMGVVNVTPDSFSDGGRWLEPEAAVAHGRHLAEQGADLLDVGGESTRPGAGRVSEAEELARVIPVVAALAEAGLAVSIDTMRSTVAAAALDAGAIMVNDVSGGRADPQLAEVVAQARVPYVLMHWRGPSDVMESLATYRHVVEEVCAELRAQAEDVVRAGVDERSLVLDPGFGFAKLARHNWELFARLDRVARLLERPLLIGTSRKRFLAEAVAAQEHRPELATDPRQRDAATAATSTLAALVGAWAVRVHEVAASADAVRVVARLTRAHADAVVGR
jgi:dihydropteroate synthase